ncbi:uncharacterized protein TNCV_2723131 [Trichonephila clavipes]|nr:uncharacterized protein TNCV_2723131 [Trichonephila clavipes]
MQKEGETFCNKRDEKQARKRWGRRSAHRADTIVRSREEEREKKKLNLPPGKADKSSRLENRKDAISTEYHGANMKREGVSKQAADQLKLSNRSAAKYSRITADIQRAVEVVMYKWMDSCMHYVAREKRSCRDMVAVSFITLRNEEIPF